MWQTRREVKKEQRGGRREEDRQKKKEMSDSGEGMKQTEELLK